MADHRIRTARLGSILIIVAIVASACVTQTESELELTPPISDGAVIAAVKQAMATRRLNAIPTSKNCLSVIQEGGRMTAHFEGEKGQLSYFVQLNSPIFGRINWRYWTENGAVESLSRFC